MKRVRTLSAVFKLGGKITGGLYIFSRIPLWLRSSEIDLSIFGVKLVPFSKPFYVAVYEHPNFVIIMISSESRKMCIVNLQNHKEPKFMRDFTNAQH